MLGALGTSSRWCPCWPCTRILFICPSFDFLLFAVHDPFLEEPSSTSQAKGYLSVFFVSFKTLITIVFNFFFFLASSTPFIFPVFSSVSSVQLKTVPLTLTSWQPGEVLCTCMNDGYFVEWMLFLASQKRCLWVGLSVKQSSLVC